MENSLALSQEAANSQLAEIFNPRSIAVVGASGNPVKAGYQFLRTLIAGGYRGKIFPVNPKEREIMGVLCYASILDVPAPLDLLVISLPAPQVLAVMSEAAQRRDIKGAVIVSAGFSETASPEWVEAERKLLKLATTA